MAHHVLLQSTKTFSFSFCNWAVDEKYRRIKPSKAMVFFMRSIYNANARQKNKMLLLKLTIGTEYLITSQYANVQVCKCANMQMLCPPKPPRPVRRALA
jgi:hypothetical protein